MATIEITEKSPSRFSKLFGRSKDTAPKKEKSSADAVPEKGVQGFLVPKHFRYRSKYRNGVFFRCTSLLLLAGLIVAGIQVYKWTIANSNKSISEEIQKVQLEESSRLQQQAAGLRPIKSKFKELEVLRRQLRIPMAPILDTIEKTIPENISVNKITWMCAPVAASGNLKRKANVQVEVYFPKIVKTDDESVMEWPNKMKQKISEYGLKITQSEWGAEKRFEPTKEQAIRAKEPLGSTRTLNINIELGGD
jgi:hypothetical protein